MSFTPAGCRLVPIDNVDELPRGFGGVLLKLFFYVDHLLGCRVENARTLVLSPVPDLFESIGRGRSAWCRKAELSYALIQKHQGGPYQRLGSLTRRLLCFGGFHQPMHRPSNVGFDRPR